VDRSDDSAMRRHPGAVTGCTNGLPYACPRRFAFSGDSSPIDDGTGQSDNTLYDGWNDTGATNAALALNATEWLSS
jgi:hypothetical protein